MKQERVYCSDCALSGEPMLGPATRVGCLVSARVPAHLGKGRTKRPSRRPWRHARRAGRGCLSSADSPCVRSSSAAGRTAPDVTVSSPANGRLARNRRCGYTIVRHRLRPAPLDEVAEPHYFVMPNASATVLFPLRLPPGQTPGGVGERAGKTTHVARTASPQRLVAAAGSALWTRDRSRRAPVRRSHRGPAR